MTEGRKEGGGMGEGTGERQNREEKEGMRGEKIERS